MHSFTLAAIQLTSGDTIAENIAALAPQVAQAAKAGARLIATPENTFYMRREGTAHPHDLPMTQHPGIVWSQEAARQHGVWLLIGSIRAAAEHSTKPFNRSVLISPEGHITAHYDKIHLFDVSTPDGRTYQESAQAQAGSAAICADIDGWKLGLSICYDLRFPALYQTLSGQGATLLSVPSAFTRPTGQAHWHTLLKARAIENACYVIAPAQCGTHPGGRETYGHSLIIDPWGQVLAEASGDRPEIILAEINPTRIAEVRGQIPVLAHRRNLQ